jgi:hypothetical protein
MGLKLFRFLSVILVLVLVFANTLKADTVTVDGTYSFGSNGYGIPPYGGTLNYQSQSFYCVDFTHDISGGMSWNVNITSLTGSSFSATFLGNQTTYEAMAWLVTNMMGVGTQTQKAEDQFAIWSLTGGPNPYGTKSALVAAALAAVQNGFTGQGFEILTPTGSTGQEFLIYVPEPSELLLLMVGLILIGIAMRKRAIAVAQAQ